MLKILLQIGVVIAAILLLAAIFYSKDFALEICMLLVFLISILMYCCEIQRLEIVQLKHYLSKYRSELFDATGVRKI